VSVKRAEKEKKDTRMFSRILDPVIMSPKFKALSRRFRRNDSFTLLDVGCGNHSPSITKRYFKRCRYFGLDVGVYNNSEDDALAMEQFYLADLEKGDLGTVPDNFFDAIVMSHVIEHLRNGLEVIEGLTHKLKSGGTIYIEFPSVRSLSLPSMPGTLHFCDDATHKRLYDLKDVVNTLLAHHCIIIKAGPRRDILKALLTPLTYLYLKYLRRTEYAVAFWDIRKFADCVLAQKK